MFLCVGTSRPTGLFDHLLPKKCFFSPFISSLFSFPFPGGKQEIHDLSPFLADCTGHPSPRQTAPRLLWQPHRNTEPQTPLWTQAASESEGDSICRRVLDRGRRRFPPVMFRLFPLPHPDNLCFLKSRVANIVLLPPSAAICFERSALVWWNFISSLASFFFFLVLLCGRKKKGVGWGERRWAVSKINAGKERLPSDWRRTGVTCKGKERKSHPPTLLLTALQLLSDAVGWFALQRRTQAEITRNEWLAGHFLSRPFVTLNSVIAKSISSSTCHDSKKEMTTLRHQWARFSDQPVAISYETIAKQISKWSAVAQEVWRGSTLNPKLLPMGIGNTLTPWWMRGLWSVNSERSSKGFSQQRRPCSPWRPTYRQPYFAVRGHTDDALWPWVGFVSQSCFLQSDKPSTSFLFSPDPAQEASLLSRIDHNDLVCCISSLSSFVPFFPFSLTLSHIFPSAVGGTCRLQKNTRPFMLKESPAPGYRIDETIGRQMLK